MRHKTRRTITAVLAVAAVVISQLPQNAVRAESDKIKRLMGIKKFALVVEGIEPVNQRKCGITKRDIETSVKYIAANSELKISTASDVTAPTLYVNANINHLQNESLCHGALSVEAYHFTQFRPIGMNTTAFYKIVIWAKEGTFYASLDRLNAAVTRMLEGYMKELVIDWKQANQ